MLWIGSEKWEKGIKSWPVITWFSIITNQDTTPNFFDPEFFANQDTTPNFLMQKLVINRYQTFSGEGLSNIDHWFIGFLSRYYQRLAFQYLYWVVSISDNLLYRLTLLLSIEFALRFIPRTMRWCRAPGVSMRALRDMIFFAQATT